MKKQKSFIISWALGISLLAVAVPSFAAKTTGTASGGWSESKGYYVNNLSIHSFFATASTKPDSHTGKRLSRLTGVKTSITL